MKNTIEKCDIAVCGSGPAGLSAGLAAAQSGARTVIFERLETVGLKLLASGGGRCNFSNILSEDEFMRRFGRDGRFMSPALKHAPRQWLIDFLASKGVHADLTDGFHFFPKSGRARDVLIAFISGISENSGQTVSSACIEKINIEDGRIRSIVVNSSEIKVKALILASGGTAWSKLGGTNAGLELAKSADHTVVKPLPAMAPLLVADKWVKGLSGVSLPNASLSFRAGKHNFFSTCGELLFTHEGLSGPAAIDISGDVAAACDKSGAAVSLSLCIDARRDMKFWNAEIDSWRRSDGKKLVRNLLAGSMTHSLADALCALAGAYDVKACEISSVQREKLVAVLSGAELTVTGAGPMDKAMAMRGGVSLKEVNPSTLESRMVKGLFFAGEILDLVGPCGGYNIQWAFSSGKLAGDSAVMQVKLD